MAITNRAPFNFEDLYTVFGAGSIFNMQSGFSAVGVSTDTRSIEKGNIFVALEGDSFNGHDYLAVAAEKGASAVVVSSARLKDGLEVPEGVAVMSTRSTQTALGVLGRYHRDRFEIPIIAVAGSNGKTTTKDMVAHYLSAKFSVLATEKNYNNKIGTPLTLLRLDSSHTACVLEIGTNQFGEIQFLCEISNPTHGLITNIGAEHLQEFGDLDGVEMEEAALFGWLRQQGGHAYINVSDPILDKYLEHLERKTAYSLAGEDAHISGRIISTAGENSQRIMLKQDKKKVISYQLPMRGITNGMNSIAASAVALSFDIDADSLVGVAESYLPPEYAEGYGRMKVYTQGNSTIINDTYNANADSTLQALEVLLDEGEGKTRIAILGDMRELGEHSSDEHQRVLQRAIEVAEKVVLVGEEYGKAKDLVEDLGSDRVDKISWFPDTASAKAPTNDLLERHSHTHTAILYKGSRGMKMESLIG